MTQAKKTFRPATSKGVCRVYELLHSRGFVSFPITDEAREKVDALVSNINAQYFGVDLYSSPEEKAIAHLYFLIKDHPFTDGNKRTASLTFEVLCDLNDLVPKYGDFTLDELAVFIEKSNWEHRRLISALTTVLFPDA